MKSKKSSSRLWLVLWVLVLGAGAALWLVPPRFAPARMVWRVPVSMGIETAEIKNKWETVEKKAEDLLPDLPPLPSLPQVMEGEEPPAITPAEKPSQPPVMTVEPTKPPLKPVEQGAGSRIALIIDDMGLAPAASARAMKLPASVTLSFLPYARQLDKQVEAAKASGHAVMLHLPMEPEGREKAGPGAILSAHSLEDVRDGTYKALESFYGYVGVNNHMGSRLTQDKERMQAVMAVLRERGVFFIDSRTSPRSIAEEAARTAGVPTAARDVFLDDTVSEAETREQLRRLEGLAKKKGFAIGIGHPHPTTLTVLEAWTKEVKGRGFDLVPVGDVVQ